MSAARARSRAEKAIFDIASTNRTTLCFLTSMCAIASTSRSDFVGFIFFALSSRAESRDPDDVTLKFPRRDPSTYARDDATTDIAISYNRPPPRQVEIAARNPARLARWSNQPGVN